jgi:hypothetical protein
MSRITPYGRLPASAQAPARESQAAARLHRHRGGGAGLLLMGRRQLSSEFHFLLQSPCLHHLAVGDRARLTGINTPSISITASENFMGDRPTVVLGQREGPHNNIATPHLKHSDT